MFVDTEVEQQRYWGTFFHFSYMKILQNLLGKFLNYSSELSGIFTKLSKKSTKILCLFSVNPELLIDSVYPIHTSQIQLSEVCWKSARYNRQPAVRHTQNLEALTGQLQLGDVWEVIVVQVQVLQVVLEN